MPRLLRPATPDDARAIFAWRNDPWIISLGTSQRTVEWPEHARWFEQALADERRLILVIEPEPGVGAGTVRLDRLDQRLAVVTIYLLREFTGRGLGVEALVEACSMGFSHWPIEAIQALVRQDNRPSLSAFAKAGFVQVKPSDACPEGHLELLLPRPSLT